MDNLQTEIADRDVDFFENVLVGFHVFGPDQIILEINTAELTMLGYTREEIVGRKRWPELIVEEQKPRFNQHWERIIKHQEVRNFEYTLVRNDGGRVDVVLNAFGRFDKSGKLLSTRGIVVDVSERKRLEQELRRSRREVEERNRSLEELNRRLREADREKTEFFSIIAHEIKSPLAGIGTLAEALITEKDVDSKEAVDGLQVIQRESRRLTELVRQVLDLSKMELGVLRLTVTAFDLSALVHEANELVDRSRTVAVHTHDIVLPIIVRADQDRIKQVLVNLLANAFRYGGAKADVWVSVGRQGAAQVIVGVHDTGPGIPPHELDNIFKKFYRLRGPTSRGESSGLGLSVVRAIISAHDQTVWAESEPGRGTSMYFTLPIAGENAPESES